jgi:hypothetical protein
MMRIESRLLLLGILIALGACSSAPDAAAPSAPSPTPPSDPSPTPPIQEIVVTGAFEPLEPGTYSTDPDLDHSTPLRVVYEIPAEGWSNWIGGTKYSDVGHVAVSITTVNNLVRHGCRDHSWADPPVRPSVDDLAAALSDLAPFRVTVPPEDVTVYDYRGRHLELTVPDLADDGDGEAGGFTRCAGGYLESWVAPFDTVPGDAFYGYTGPGYVEEIWILDVDGTRLMITAGRSLESPSEDIEEQHAILDSIRIEP